MKNFHRLTWAVIVLFMFAAIWLWWIHPDSADMASYAPADALVYIEANSLTKIATGLESTDAWKALAPHSTRIAGFGKLGWLGRIAVWTGVGSTEALILSRAQIAVVVVAIDGADAGEALKIRPRAAIIAETHTGETRTRAAIEAQIGDFAKRAYVSPTEKHEQIDGNSITTWTAPGGERMIVAAVAGSVAVVGNDQATVLECFAVRRGERPSLAGNGQMAEMRRRVTGPGTLAFGYISPAGSLRLFQVAAPVYGGLLSSDPRVQGAAATLLPQLASKLLGGVGWGARIASGSVEDRYFIGLQNEFAARLRDSLAAPAGTLPASQPTSGDVFALLPGDTYSVSLYNYPDPLAAWTGLNAAVSSQLPVVFSFLFTEILKSGLQGYGIENAEGFLRAVGPEIITARLNDSGDQTLIVVKVKDEEALKAFVLKRLGTSHPLIEKVGDAQMQVSAEPRRGAACFVGGYLILGAVSEVRHSLMARSQNQTLASSAPFQGARTLVASNEVPGDAITLTKGAESARSFIDALSPGKGTSRSSSKDQQLAHSIDGLNYTVTATRPVEGGFERATHSAFGQFATILTLLTPESDAR